MFYLIPGVIARAPGGICFAHSERCWKTDVTGCSPRFLVFRFGGTANFNVLSRPPKHGRMFSLSLGEGPVVRENRTPCSLGRLQLGPGVWKTRREGPLALTIHHRSSLLASGLLTILKKFTSRLFHSIQNNSMIGCVPKSTSGKGRDCGPGKCFEVQAEAPINRGDHFGRFHRTLGRIAPMSMLLPTTRPPLTVPPAK
jgi:hypothetical protein